MLARWQFPLTSTLSFGGFLLKKSPSNIFHKNSVCDVLSTASLIKPDAFCENLYELEPTIQQVDFQLTHEVLSELKNVINACFHSETLLELIRSNAETLGEKHSVEKNRAGRKSRKSQPPAVAGKFWTPQIAFL